MTDENVEQKKSNKITYMWRESLDRLPFFFIGWATIIKGNLFGDSFDINDNQLMELSRKELFKLVSQHLDLCFDQYVRTVQYHLENYDDLPIGNKKPDDVFQISNYVGYADTKNKLLVSFAKKLADTG